MSEALSYIWLGIHAVFEAPALFRLAGIGIPAPLVMLLGGLLTGVSRWAPRPGWPGRWPWRCRCRS